MEYIDRKYMIGQNYENVIEKIEECLYHFDEWQKMQENLYHVRALGDSLNDLHTYFTRDVIAPLYNELEQQERNEPEQNFWDKIENLEEANMLTGIEQLKAQFDAVQTLKEQIGNQLRAINVALRDKNASLLAHQAKFSIQGLKENIKNQMSTTANVAKTAISNRIEYAKDDNKEQENPQQTQNTTAATLNEAKQTEERVFEIAMKTEREKVLKEEEEKKKKKYYGRQISYNGR